MSPIYKVLSRAEWASAQAAGRFDGSAADVADGYIHLSTAEQLAGTLAKWFAGRDDLVLLTVDPAALDDVRWEPARGGALFPHAYSSLPCSAVLEARELPAQEP